LRRAAEQGKIRPQEKAGAWRPRFKRQKTQISNGQNPLTSQFLHHEVLMLCQITY